MRAGGRVDAPGAIEILDAERRAFQFPCFAGCDLRIGRVRHFQRLLRGFHHIGVQRVIRGFDGIDESLRQLPRGEGFCGKAVERGSERQFGKIGHEASSVRKGIFAFVCRARGKVQVPMTEEAGMNRPAP